MPLPRSTIPVGPAALTVANSLMLPPWDDKEGTNDMHFGTQSRGFSIRCLRFK
jgi:hypothetical protein